MLQKCPQRCDGRSPIGSKQSQQKKMCVDHRYIPGQPRENKQWAGAPTRCSQSGKTSHLLKYFPPDYILGATAKQEGNQKWYIGVWLGCTGNCRFLWQIAWSYFLVSLKAPTGPRICIDHWSQIAESCYVFPLHAPGQSYMETCIGYFL